VTPGEWAGIAGAILAVGALADRLVQRLSSPPPAPPREVLLPPAPVAPPVAVLESRLESAERRIAGLEDRERAEAAEAATYRGEVKASIARLLERSRSLGQREERASE